MAELCTWEAPREEHNWCQVDQTTYITTSPAPSFSHPFLHSYIHPLQHPIRISKTSTVSGFHYIWERPIYNARCFVYNNAYLFSLSTGPEPTDNKNFKKTLVDCGSIR